MYYIFFLFYCESVLSRSTYFLVYTRVVSNFNSLCGFLSRSLFLLFTPLSSRLSFLSTRERLSSSSYSAACRAGLSAKNADTRNLRRRAHETIRDKFLRVDWQVTERHGRSISPSRRWSRSRRASRISPYDQYTPKKRHGRVARSIIRIRESPRFKM